jgi:hypothetical protein
MNILDKGANQVKGTFSLLKKILDPNVFSQYGNWVMNPALNNTTMYQVDDSGKGKFFYPKTTVSIFLGREKGVPASLLFGHGMSVDNVSFLKC